MRSLPPAHVPNEFGATSARSILVCPFKSRVSPDVTRLVAEDDPLDFGSTYHYMMRLQYENVRARQRSEDLPWTDPYGTLHEAYDQGILNRLGPDASARMDALLRAAQPVEGLDGTIFAVEQQCAIFCGTDDEGEPVYYMPTVDLITRSAQTYHMIDHKTGRAKVNAYKLFEYQMDVQFIGLAAMVVYGFWIVGDDGQWTRVKPESYTVQVRHAQSTDPFRVGCHELAISTGAILGFRQAIVDLTNRRKRYARTEAELRASGASELQALTAWPRTMGGSAPCCAKYNKGRCDAWELCRG